MVTLSNLPFPPRTENSLVFKLIFLPRMSTRAEMKAPWIFTALHLVLPPGHMGVPR